MYFVVAAFMAKASEVFDIEHLARFVPSSTPNHAPERRMRGVGCCRWYRSCFLTGVIDCDRFNEEESFDDWT